MKKYRVSTEQERIARWLVTIRECDEHGVTWGSATEEIEKSRAGERQKAARADLMRLVALGLIRLYETEDGSGDLIIEDCVGPQILASDFGLSIRDKVLRAIYELADGKMAARVALAQAVQRLGVGAADIESAVMWLRDRNYIWRHHEARGVEFALLSEGIHAWEDGDGPDGGNTVHLYGDQNAIAIGGSTAIVKVTQGNALPLVQEMRQQLRQLAADQISIGMTLEALISAMETKQDSEESRGLTEKLWREAQAVVQFGAGLAALYDAWRKGGQP